jgi:hypothetical protein
MFYYCKTSKFYATYMCIDNNTAVWIYASTKYHSAWKYVPGNVYDNNSKDKFKFSALLEKDVFLNGMYIPMFQCLLPGPRGAAYITHAVYSMARSRGTWRSSWLLRFCTESATKTVRSCRTFYSSLQVGLIILLSFDQPCPINK